MIRKIVNISAWVLFIAGVLVLLSFSQEKKKETVYKDEIRITLDDSGNEFMNRARVNTILKNMGFKKGEDSYNEIDTKKLEKKLLGISCVESVQVFKNLDGSLQIDVSQRKPIARVINNNGHSLYVDDKGKTMPISEYYTARVLVVNGYLNIKPGLSIAKLNENPQLKKTTLLDEIYELASYINQDKFLRAQIEQIYIEKNKEVTLIPKVGSQEIIFGEVKKMEEKFNKLLLFYKEGINPNNLNLYKTINLKYKNQIVCKKK